MKFANQTFTTDVTLDCNEFVDCVFRNCTVIHQGGPFSLTRTNLENVRFSMGGLGQNVLFFLRLVRASHPTGLEELLDGGPQPTPEYSGTIN